MNIPAPIPAELVLSILAPSYLMTHRLGESVAQSLVDFGTLSEEIFRGDRLPPLPFPEPSNPDHQPPETPEG